MKFITVYTTLSVPDAELIRSRLDSANIEVNIKNEDPVIGIETFGGIQVQVPEDRVAEAKALIDYKDPSAS